MDKAARMLAKAMWTLVRSDRKVGAEEEWRAWRVLAGYPALNAFFVSMVEGEDGVREERQRIARRWTERTRYVRPRDRAGITRLPAIVDLVPVWTAWGEMILAAPPVAVQPDSGDVAEAGGEVQAGRPTMPSIG